MAVSSTAHLRKPEVRDFVTTQFALFFLSVLWGASYLWLVNDPSYNDDQSVHHVGIRYYFISPDWVRL